MILTLSGADVRARSLVLIPKHLGDVTDFFRDISFENEI